MLLRDPNARSTGPFLERGGMSRREMNPKGAAPSLPHERNRSDKYYIVVDDHRLCCGRPQTVPLLQWRRTFRAPTQDHSSYLDVWGERWCPEVSRSRGSSPGTQGGTSLFYQLAPSGAFSLPVFAAGLTFHLLTCAMPRYAGRGFLTIWLSAHQDVVIYVGWPSAWPGKSGLGPRTSPSQRTGAWRVLATKSKLGN